MILLQAAGGSSGSVLSGIILLIFLASLIYFAKRSTNVKMGVYIIGIIFLIGVCIFQNKGYLGNIYNPLSIILLICSLLLMLYFLYSCFQIYSISKIPNKTKQDVIKRKKTVEKLGFIFALTVTFVIVGFSLVSIIDPNYQGSISKWVETTTKSAFFATMAVLLMDGIISKICSPIYTVEVIPNLEKFVLYLRSFDRDKVNKKDEKYICGTFKNLFPTYAIGDPNSLLQPYGADRIYATDNEWQEAVSTLMKKAQLIVIRCGLTNGTIWEMDKIISSSYINKCVFIIDDVDTLTFLRSKLSEIGVNVEYPIFDFQKGQYAIYLYHSNSDENWALITQNLRNEKDVETLINKLLKVNSDLDKEYSSKLDIRHHSIRKIFSKEVPTKIRKSLNWGILSPIINMRHWPSTYWIIFILLGLAGGMIFQSLIPVYIIILFFFIFGNRIEWTQQLTSSSGMLLKKQRREASLMWFSMITTGVLAWICIVLLMFI